MRSTHSDITHGEPETAEAFIADLKRWRDVRGFSQKRLAASMAYDASYVSKIESGHQQPTSGFARRADEILNTGGSLARLQREYRAGTPGRPRHLPEEDPGAPRSLTVCHEIAECRYVDGVYHTRVRRELRNASDQPVTRYLIRISVDRHPATPEQSNELYRHRPLTWEEINLHASSDGEPMRWNAKHDRDAFKEVWLLFENDACKFPLYPGESTWIDYGYTVGADKWGQWFQRAIRLPTERLTVQVAFPAALEPAVWGIESTMTADAMPVRTAITQHDEGDERIFCWTTDNPPLHARYRFEWRLRGHDADHERQRPSERMRQLGVVQADDPILRSPATAFELPAEAELAAGVGELLTAFLHPLRIAHSFGKGMGLAAPQIGIGRRAAIVQAPDEPPLVLYNPRIIDRSDATDDQYEGCLSFFDVRGLVTRPLRIDVEHTTLDGTTQITSFELAAARLWTHEIDHLDGLLYKDRMPPDREPVPVEHYQGTGASWSY